jgi:CHAT domain-containing protein/tetratricopeptide (TPR) repeat protein
VSKAARIRRERAAKEQVAPAEDEHILSVFGIVNLDRFESHLEQHPRLTNAATIAQLSHYARAPGIGAPFRDLADLLAADAADRPAAWRRFRTTVESRDTLVAQLDEEAQAIRTLLVGGHAGEALTRSEAALSAAQDAGLPLSAGEFHALHARAVTHKPDLDRASLMNAAIAEYEQALTLTQHSGQAAEIRMQIALANAQNPTGDASERIAASLSMLRDILETLDPATPPDTVSLIQTNLASALLRHHGPDRVGELQEARELCVAALTQRSPRRDPYDWAHTQLNLAGALEQLAELGHGTPQEAIDAYNELLDEGEHIPERWLVGFAHFSLGRLYNHAANPNPQQMVRASETNTPAPEPKEMLPLAYEHLREALPDTAQAPEPLHHARTLAELANVEDQLGESQHAIVHGREALQIMTIDSDPSGCAHAAGRLAGTFAAEGDWPEAADNYRLAVRARELIFHARLETSTREADIRNQGNLARWAAFALAKTGALAEAALTLENGKTRELRRRFAFQEDSEQSLAGLPRELADEYRELMNDIAAAPLGAPAAGTMRRLQQLLATIRSHPGFESFATAASRADLERAVEPGWPVLYINPTPQGTMLLMLNRTETGISEHLRILDAPTSSGVFARLMMGSTTGTLDETIDVSRALLFIATGAGDAADMDITPALDYALPWLGDALMRPAQEMLSELGAEGVSLIVSGNLAGAPLHAAPFGPEGRCLIDKLDVRYAPSAVVLGVSLKRAVRPESKQATLVALADPERDVPGGHLPAAEAEITEIARNFNAANVHQAAGREASSKFLTRHAADADYLHLACHATGGMLDSSEAALALADGLLSPFELTEIAKLHTRLAVASACETAHSELTGLAEEVHSIAVILLAAGSACAIATQWAVNDASTAMLMIRLYDVMITQRLRPPEALRAAQLWIRDLDATEEQEFLRAHPALARDIGSRRARGERIGAPLETIDATGRFSDPVYWAPFVAIGA